MTAFKIFQNLPAEEVAHIVKNAGLKVVVFPINGTRRWFTLEYGEQEFEDPLTAYLDIAMMRHIELYKMIFDHGVDTLLTPVIGPEILATRDGYMQKIGAKGLARIVTHPAFLTFYEEYNVRVRFYGEYRKHLSGTAYDHLVDLFDSISDTTQNNDQFRLFFGAFADNLDATDVVAEFSVNYYKEHGKIPDRKKIIEMYYGEFIDKAHIFIGFDRLTVFDYPLLNWGNEDLYFTISPSLYLDKFQLRCILYDHLYSRQTPERDYESLTKKELNSIYNYYNKNIDNSIGVGKVYNGFWIPKGQ